MPPYIAVDIKPHFFPPFVYIGNVHISSWSLSGVFDAEAHSRQDAPWKVLGQVGLFRRLNLNLDLSRSPPAFAYIRADMRFYDDYDYYWGDCIHKAIRRLESHSPAGLMFMSL